MAVNTFLWFAADAEAAAELYAATVPNSRIAGVSRQGDGSAFILELDLDGHAVTLMNGGPGHPHTDAASLQVIVDTQDEIDRIWDALTQDGGTPGPCGWLTDRFGVSWQVVPEVLPKLLSGEPDRVIAVGTALRSMSKLDIAALRQAHDQA